MTALENALQRLPCSHCDKLPVKSRRNTICRSCGAPVCIRCQMAHFVERHEP